MRGLELLHLVKYFFKVDAPNTQTSKNERAAIERYAKDANLAIEIGVFEGVNTVVIGQHIKPAGKLYGIDPFFKGKLGVCFHKYVAKLNLKRHKVNKKVVLIEKLSGDAISDVPASCDFIFIDGDHSYDGIKKDWEQYSLKVRPGGIIALHDTTVPEFDPGRVALGSIAFFKDVIVHDKSFEKVETIDSLNIMRRIS
ncbi:class I SAM-dependent methyltransferase [Paraflavitalea pollutisoli]|uniref:class I SAM-dependent methyltransferase n=1 Tax=Paraflavitalea pollutisoli TaxID=3034143 RepID=UPI0023EC0B55|nr:class I SAM-dependent methyltransferase [Paraflavitalea sp. H1-2-19X]